MTHPEFIAAYREGRVEARVDRAAAAKLVSARMMLPLFLLPILGLAVAMALVGAWTWGALLFVAAMAFRFAVRASAQGFVVTKALADGGFYEEMVRTGILTLYTSP